METITIAISDHDIEYVPILTNAFQQYDYAYTIYLGETHSVKFDKKARLILIPVESEDYQRGRYASGLFFSERVDLLEHPMRYITNELWKRLHKSEDSQIGVPKTVEKKEISYADYKDQPRNRTVQYTGN